MTNPLLDFSGLPRFDAITPAHVTPAIDTLLAQARAAVEQARTQALDFAATHRGGAAATAAAVVELLVQGAGR